jgi:hypothetical protein
MPQSRTNNRNRGFGAFVAVLIMSSGSAAISFAVLNAAVSYADLVYRKELRIQEALNRSACADTLGLVRAKDQFAAGTLDLPEFNCVLSL